VLFTNNNCRVCDVDKGLPFDDNSVDILLAITAIHWVDFELFKKEAQRTLKPNGVLALTSFIKMYHEVDGMTSTAKEDTWQLMYTFILKVFIHTSLTHLIRV
jgi:ubiquinone/menaquinone biosynthesis C-methylase UbiE